MPHYLQYINSGRIPGYTATSEYQSDWDFIQFPIGEVDGRTGNPPVVEPGSGFYLFSGSVDNSVYGSIHLPASLDLNGDYIPAVKWTKTSSAAGDVVWQLESRVVRPGEVLGSYGSAQFATESENFKNDDTDSKYAISLFPTKDIDEGVEDVNQSEGEIVSFILSRQPGDAGDTYGANARLLAFGLYVQVDTLGSEEPLIK